MDHDDHCKRIGYIHLNLTAIESSLRFFLLKANNETFAAPKLGETELSLTHISNYASLDWLIREYNEKLDKAERAKFAVDDKPVFIRDALAHGRLVSPSNNFPLTLWKFGKVKKGRVPIEFNQVLTMEWLDDAWKMILQQKETVDACSKQRGYPIN